MRLAMIGLGKMGGNVVRRWRGGGILAAGLALLCGKRGFALNRPQITGLWRHASVVRSVFSGHAARPTGHKQ